MNWHPLIDPALSGRLCLTLLHSVWQVALLAAVVWFLDRLLRKRSVELRYVVHVGALIVALVALPVTYRLIDVAETSEELSVAEMTPVESVADLSSSPLISQTEPPEVVNSTVAQPIVPVTRVEGPFPATADSGPSGVSPSSDETARNWLQMAPWITAFYAAGVVLMLIRLTIGIISANRLGAHANRIKEGPLVEILRSLADRWSMSVVPALAQAERVIVPKLVGLVRPTILLPASAVSGLSTDELELILAHEMAHVRRKDMWVNLLQRIAESLLFFNPALWYLTRRISTLREYCCDEMACRSRSDSDVEERLRYASALLRVTELANPHLVTRTDLAALAASGRSPSEVRRRVARLLGETVREPLQFSRGGWLMWLGVVTVLFLSPALWGTYADTIEDRTDSQGVAEEEKANDAEPKADDQRTFQLTVVGPDGKPVPHAAIHLRTHPAVTAKQILRGEYVKAVSYGPYVKTDEQGRLTILRPENLQRFNIDIKHPGYGPYWAEWASLSPQLNIPDKFTAELDAGWSVGGVIVDEAGQPVEGAQVGPSLKYKKRPGDTSQLGVGTRILTDANGEWRFDHVPVSKKDVHIFVNHPDFAPLRQRVPREGFGIELDARPTARIELQEGLSFTGTVTDDAGKPIVGAVVKTKFLNDLRKATTGKQGHYRIAGCEPRMTRVIVFAAGMATDKQVVRVADDMQPVDFVMKPGGKIRIRVVDENGKGIPKARIFFQEWRGRFQYFEFDHVSQYADENGVWEWNEAPLDEFKAAICRPGGMQLSEQSLIARDEEYVFTPPRALVVSGRVIDAKTKKPIEKFRVTPGLRNSDPRIWMNWIPNDSFEATDGEYQIRLTHGYPAHLVRIEADGYQVAISRDIKTDEGKIDVDFELTPAKDIAADIVTADGQPAANAQISLGVAGSQISVRNGAIDLSTTSATVVAADSHGYFSLPARTEPFQIVVTHPAGYAYLKSDESSVPNPITLTKWARLEGVFRVGKVPQPNVGLSLHSNPIRSYGDDVANIFTDHNVTTGKDGHYVFERVFPGNVGIERRIIFMVDEGAQEVTSAVRVRTTLFAGKTATLDLGGTGRPIVGQLLSPADFKDRVLWQFATVNAQIDLEPPPTPELPEEVRDDPKKYQAWWESWSQTPEGRDWKVAYDSYRKTLRESPTLKATVAKDGSFRIDDVPPGDYVLSARFNQHAAGSLRDIKFTVSPVEAGHDVEPVELGTLKLLSAEAP